MKKVFIIHGFKGKPNGGWRPWLMDELAMQKIYACALAMPNPNNPHVEEWLKEIDRHVERNKGKQIYLVGHSLGSTAILRFLEKTNSKNIKACYLVSTPVFKSSKKKVGGFLNDNFDFEKIKSSADKFIVIHGLDDRAVSFEQGEALSRELDCKLISIEKGGHLNGSSGWKKLPQLLDEINIVL